MAAREWALGILEFGMEYGTEKKQFDCWVGLCRIQP